jgi:hypothetical protein
MDKPMPLYENITFASSLEAAPTVILFPLFSSYNRHCEGEDSHVRAGRADSGEGRGQHTCLPRFRCQNWQSAAPPAMVPSRYLLISMTFFTVCDAGTRCGVRACMLRSAQCGTYICKILVLRGNPPQ